MFKIENYLENLTGLLKTYFKTRLLYVGLQGSYLRNEACPASDIDIMVVLDAISRRDLDDYRHILTRAGNYDKSCGFICSRNDLANWNALEVCHLLNTTGDYYGKLSDFVPEYTKNDIKNFIKLSTCNIYHELCHRYIHSEPEKNKPALPALYKSVFFVLQNIYYIESGEFVRTKKELLLKLDDGNKVLFEMAEKLDKSKEYDFETAFDMLLCWCQKIIGKDF